MSSSSSYSNFNNNPRKVVAEHDVFLSFRGEDTRSGFTSHLYDALVREGIRTFFDDDKLARGKVISTGLMKAIQGSRRSVVILSENYAFSSWCLTELCKIVECMDTSGLIVLPIFYHVNPSHVRKLIGSYREAFKKHDNNPKLDLEEVETWRDALKRVGNLAGWTLEEGDVEAKFIKDFIADISSQLDIRNESPHEAARRSRLQDVVYFDHKLVSKMVDPANAPIVVGKLRDDECPEDFIRGFLLPIRPLKECDKRDIEAHIVQNFIQDVPQVTNDTTKEKNVILTKQMRKKKKKKNVINTTIGKGQSFLSDPQSSKMLDTSDDGQDHDEDRLSNTIEPSADEDCWSTNLCPRDDKDCWSNFFEQSDDEDRWSKTLDRSDNQDLWSNFFNQ